MKKAQFTAALRAAVVIAGAVATTSGHFDDSTVQQVGGAVVTLAGLIWSQISTYRKATKIDALASLARDPVPTPPHVVDAVLGRELPRYD